ncbi:P-loop containing nucleoside triphosphate hydrolase protein [Thelephora terrestris]|uniref:P-loop containing nucleoside triphosphate hydrolase protein n=1 Tax=Thelephora terrestris TaxID=56493 RepID=A0A9P6L428_9AGAM|nr:P-loop containing nucleoside triphosphate hydrolase protein [Thelephora terrestris]
MSYTSYWKGKSQKPPKKEPSASTSNPQSLTENSWVLMDTDAAPPPTYPEATPQAEPERPPTRSSTTGSIQPPTEEDLPEVAIAIMGATGTGKSTFINLISGSSLGVSKGLRSCTNSVQVAGAFNLDGRRVVLIDTPGFDDTTRSDTDVLKMIAAFLATSYERGNTLAGVLYFHRISDFRMGGVSTRNFNMFRKLCGDNTLQNVVVVTNMWGEVDPQTGNDREAELMREDIFFKPVLEKGAKMARHQNSAPSAEDIIRLILSNHPLPLRIQEELVDEHKDISDTGAGEELNREINAQIRRHQEEMRLLKEEMEQAIRNKDEETKRELEIETKRMQREIERFQNDARRLESDYKNEKGKLESRLGQMELEAREEADRIAAEYQRQVDELRSALQSSAEASEREKAEMLEQIDQLSRRGVRAQAVGPAGHGFFSMIGAILDQLIPLRNGLASFLR